MDQLSLDVAFAGFRRPVSPPSTGAPSFPVRRRTRRASCNAPAQLDATEQSLVGMCSDISLGGMFFLGPVLPVGEKLSLTMDLPALGSVRVLGEVLAHRQHAGGSGMAIRFASLGQRELSIITQFVADRSL